MEPNYIIDCKELDLWLRFHLSGNFEPGTFELGVVPVNQYWELRYISTNGKSLKSPEYRIRVNQYLLAVVAKEGFGQENFRGDNAALPGEKVNLEVATTGELGVTLIFVRRIINGASAIPKIEIPREVYEAEIEASITVDPTSV